MTRLFSVVLLLTVLYSFLSCIFLFGTFGTSEMSDFTPCLVAAFHVGATACKTENLQQFLWSVCENTPANRNSITLPHFCSSIEKYAEDHVKAHEPEGMKCDDFARLIASNFFEDSKPMPFEPHLSRCCDMLKDEYKADPRAYLFLPLLPRYLGLVMCCTQPTEEDYEYCCELRDRCLDFFPSVMPGVNLRVSVCRKAPLSGVKDMYRTICEEMDADPLASFTHKDAFFCMLNNPCPLHRNFLFIMKREMMRAMVRCVGVGAICCQDHTKKSMALISFPLSTTVVKGERLDHLFDSPFYRQIVGSGTKMWGSAVMQFVAFYKTDKEHELVNYQPMVLMPWPYDEPKEGVMMGRDSADELLDFFISSGHYGHISHTLRKPENARMIAPSEPIDEHINLTKIVYSPRRLLTIPQTCDYPIPSYLKPPKPPIAVYTTPPCNLDSANLLKYFVIMYEAVVLDCLSSFSPGPDSLSSPAKIVEKTTPPEALFKLAFKFICNSQRAALTNCLGPLKYNNCGDEHDRGGSNVTDLGGKARPRLLRDGNAEESAECKSPEGRLRAGGGHAGGGITDGTDGCTISETPI